MVQTIFYEVGEKISFVITVIVMTASNYKKIFSELRKVLYFPVTYELTFTY